MNVDRFISKQPCKVNRNFYPKPIFSIVYNKTDMLRLINLYCQSTEEVFDYFRQYIDSDIVARYEEDDTFELGTEQDMFEITSLGSDVSISAERFPQFYVHESEIEFDLDFSEGPYVFCTLVQEDFDRFGNTSTVLIYECKMDQLQKNGIAT